MLELKRLIILMNNLVRILETQNEIIETESVISILSLDCRRVH